MSETTEELVEKKAIEGTPFTAIRYEDKWFLTMGKYRLTNPADTLEEVEADAKEASWFRIMQIVQIMIDEDKTKNKN